MSDSGYLHSVGDIAIIGMSGRFPGANNLDEFWQNLRDGVESISFFSDHELQPGGINSNMLNHPNYVKAGAILTDIDLFDAPFFGYSPREAEITDPQHRIFLEQAWAALENAGYDSERYSGSIGIFAGASMDYYLLSSLYPNRVVLEELGILPVVVGNKADHLTTRVSYKLNLKGPSLNVQTACSTSLVAVCLACQSLLSYQCDMAMAGGISIQVPQKSGYLYQEGGIFSPDGHCRAFDAKAQGTIFGNGVGLVVMKRLEDALADGDSIQAVIKGSAINNDGAVKMGYMAPGVEGQADVISMAQALGGTKPETISYVEAHGTGTLLGDPIEIAALTKAFRRGTSKNGFCAIGSVKTNIGHSDAAAGIAGLLKTILALKHKALPPSLNLEQPNPQIDFANSPFYINTRLNEWKTNGGPRRAGVNAFGIGGTNAHVVLEEAPAVGPAGEAKPRQLIVLSAGTDSALESTTANLVQHLEQHPELNLADVAYTLQVGRRALPYRRAVVCQDVNEALSTLKDVTSGQVLTSVAESKKWSVAFMFSGQGAQYVNMGRELYEAEPTFHEQVDLCSELLVPHLGCDLREKLYPPKSSEQSPNGETKEATQQLNQTWLTQPALFVIEYALAKLWAEWGIRPQAMIGHSIGEYVAACLAGVFSLEDALWLVATRGRLMQGLAEGSMLAVSLPVQEVDALLAPSLSLAAINAPSLCVVSGPPEPIGKLEDQLTEQGVYCRRLSTSHAFHSKLMDPILESFVQQVKQVTLNPPQIPYLSNVTGTWITAEEATDIHYWATHLRQTVRFADGVSELYKDSGRILLEVGPGRTLCTLALQQSEKNAGSVVLSSLRQPQEKHSDLKFLYTTLGQLWLAGVQVDWLEFHAREHRQRVPLPTYPFERQRYWIEPNPQADAFVLPTKRPNLADWLYLPSWKRSMPPLRMAPGRLAQMPQCWLVFVDFGCLGTGLVKRLEQENQTVVCVKAGDGFDREDDCHYTLRPDCVEDYGVLLNELKADGKFPQHIVHLWSVTETGADSAWSDSLEQVQNLGFYSLIFLAQALGEQASRKSIHWDVISNHLHNVTGEECLYPGKATLLGACKVIPQEYPQLTCRSLEVILPDRTIQPESELVEQLLAELGAPAENVVVAYRGRHRWVQAYAAAVLDQESDGSHLREKGVYLITGGLGGIGLVMAEYLARTVQARLVLVGRSGLPAREMWADWLTAHPDPDRTSETIRRVQAIEALGAAVLVLRADVADLAQMQAVLAQSEERFGAIHGILHAAGIAGGGLIQLKTRLEAEKVLAPKVRGTLVLETLFRDKPLDFLALFSSIAAVWGGIGQVDYCAANAFLDACAQRNFSRPGPWTVSINWDLWQEVGMGVNVDIPQELVRRQEQLLAAGIRSEEGAKVFDWILRWSTLPQVIVSTKDLLRALERESQKLATEDWGKTPTARTIHPRPNLPNTYVAPQSELEQSIATICQEILGIEPVGVHDNFFELGGHSLLATQLLSRVRDTFTVELPLRRFFETPTISELALAIAEKQLGDTASDPRLAALLSQAESPASLP